MSTQPRYVRVRTLRLPIVGRVWRCYACGLYSETSWGQSLSALVASRAERHAAECPAVAAATERDQLRAELTRLRDDRDRLRDRIQELVSALNEALEERRDT